MAPPRRTCRAARTGRPGHKPALAASSSTHLLQMRVLKNTLLLRPPLAASASICVTCGAMSGMPVIRGMGIGIMPGAIIMPPMGMGIACIPSGSPQKQAEPTCGSRHSRRCQLALALAAYHQRTCIISGGMP